MMQSSRAELERRIVEKEWTVELSLRDTTWLNSPEFDDFLQAWLDLVDYYEEHGDDTQISVEVLRSFVDYSRMLRNVILDPASTDEACEKARETLTSLENSLEGIIREVVTYLDGKSRND